MIHDPIRHPQFSEGFACDMCRQALADCTISRLRGSSFSKQAGKHKPRSLLQRPVSCDQAHLMLSWLRPG